MTKPLRTRLRLISDVMALLTPGAPFVQFTYAMVPPIPKALSGITARASELIWLNLPPARVWVYRGALRLRRPIMPGLSASTSLVWRDDVTMIESRRWPCPKILVLPGSTRAGSHNVRLAALAAKELTLIDADVTRISLADYPLPIYEADLDARIRPAGQRRQAQADDRWRITACSSPAPEYSASVHAAFEERARLGLARARARRSDLCRLQGPRLRHRLGLARQRRRLALADGVAADSRARLRCARDPRAGLDRQRRSRLRRHGQSRRHRTANLLRAQLARLVDMASG